MPNGLTPQIKPGRRVSQPGQAQKDTLANEFVGQNQQIFCSEKFF
jgi:hypothetical protein